MDLKKYAKPITKNGISSKSIIYKAKESKEIQEDLDKLSKLNEPTTKNDLAVEEFAERVLKAMDFAIKATDSKDNYSIGMRNGIRYSKSLIDSKEPDFEHIENDNCDKGCDFCKHTSECMPSKE